MTRQSFIKSCVVWCVGGDLWLQIKSQSGLPFPLLRLPQLFWTDCRHRKSVAPLPWHNFSSVWFMGWFKLPLCKKKNKNVRLNFISSAPLNSEEGVYMQYFYSAWVLKAVHVNPNSFSTTYSYTGKQHFRVSLHNGRKSKSKLLRMAPQPVVKTHRITDWLLSTVWKQISAAKEIQCQKNNDPKDAIWEPINRD